MTQGGKMKEQRIDFPDYPAEEQERDVQNYAKKLKPLRHAYLMRVGGEWGHLILTQQGDNIAFYGEKNLTEVYYDLKENFPDYTAKVIQNQGLENYLKTVKKQREKKYGKQLRIDFSKQRD